MSMLIRNTGLTVALTGLFAFASTALADSSFGPLVTPAELSAELDKVGPIVLDIRGKDFAAGHIAGAVDAPYGKFRGPKKNPGEVPDIANLESFFETLGLEIDRPIVITSNGKSDTDFGASARVYWTLKSTGFTDLSILNGGLQEWKAAGLPLSTETNALTATELELTFNNQWTATTEEVTAISRGEVDALLLDARPADFFEGKKAHDAAKIPGTIPTAENYSYTSFFSPKSSAIQTDLGGDSLAKALGIEKDKEIVSFCNTGHWAATSWFAMSEIAGLDNVKMYPGSMVEYTHQDLEVANAPSLIENFKNKLK